MSFRRTAFPGRGPALARPAEQPAWLVEARDALLEAGAYLAFATDERVRVLALQGGWSRIGRSLTAHVRLDDPTVSRRHAMIERVDGDGLRLLDDRSLNGVFLNGRRIQAATALEDADVIAVGRYTLHVIRLASPDA